MRESRVGKKPTVVQAKKTRSCVVRQEKVEEATPPPKVTRSSIASSKAASTAKEIKKPIVLTKKRIITQKEPTTPITMGRQPKPKEKIKSPPQKFVTKALAPSSSDVEMPPTIAAGRSRRAIKPNPKYASDDMVTPKSIKNVGATMSSSSLNKSSSSAAAEKYRKSSDCSLDDFFSKESSDEFDDTGFDSTTDKPYNSVEKDSDSDFPDIPTESPKTLKTRQRPKMYKNVMPESGRRAPINSTAPVKTITKIATSATAETNTQISAKSTTVVGKTTPTQLHQIRKSIVGNVSRVALPLTGRKRKSNDIDKDEENSVARKRFLLASEGTAQKVPDRQSNASGSSVQLANRSAVVRKTVNIQTINGKKMEITKVRQEHPKVEQNKLKTFFLSPSSDANETTAPKLNTKVTREIKTILPQPSTLGKSANVKQVIVSTGSKRSASPAATKLLPLKSVATPKKDESITPTKDELSPTAGNDYEIMPTFTIVNIHDIINKKGDVLIKSSLPTKESKSNKRKALHNTILSEKFDPERVKNVHLRPPNQSSMPPSKKILSHKLLNKAANVPASQRSTRTATMLSPTKGITGQANKPAPRILNSMVGRTTLPVKFMISNMEDSADETFPDEEKNIKRDIDDEETEDGGEENNGKKGEASFGGRRMLTTSTPFQSFMKTAPATKENSLAATNRMSNKMLQQRSTPETVLISRQGNKIIKKITCFETWFVINPPEQRPVKIERNLLEIPLIKLANIAKQIKLPSNNWNSKVTLFEVTPGMLNKTKLILYTGDLNEQNITEENRGKYQPSSVMFRRKVDDRANSRLPYDRAVIFKNKTFFTNIEGKNVKLEGAPTSISKPSEVETLLDIVDFLVLKSSFVEATSALQ